MEFSVKQIEDLSLNAWPSHKMELYDGWILRFSYFYTHRTNSVEQFGTSSLPWSVKIPYCEKEYERLGSPAVFKISPLVSPDFDFMLENRGYRIEHTTHVMTLDLTAVITDPCLPPAGGTKTVPGAITPGDHIRPDSDSPRPCIELMEGIPEEWIRALFSLKGTTDSRHLAVVPSMYQAIPKETICVCVRTQGRITATALGILDRDYIGIYAVHVREELRGRGIARAMCRTLLEQGRKKGADKAYLQVVDGNVPARCLYESLGFSQLYTYWFRVQPADRPPWQA